MKTKLIAVRHGETEWNKIERQQGHLDSSLTELGLLQAKAVGDGLLQYQIDTFYTSDSGRAVQTSEIIRKIVNVNFTTDLRLRERNLGILQGITQKDFVERYPDESENFNKNDPDYILPRGESIRQRYQRAVDCVEDLARQNIGKTVLIVSHGGVLMSMFYKALDLPLSQKRSFSLFNGSINIFSLDENMKWNLDTWGTVDHLTKQGLSTLDDN
jgi:probable phosphoglycerate mutase